MSDLSEWGPDQPVLGAPAPDAATIRDELQRLVLMDLLGPAGGPGEEMAEGRVSERYLVGMLAPRQTGVVREAHEPVAYTEGGNGDDDEPEPAAPAARTFFQSSAGFTCAVDVSVTELEVTAVWGHYTRTASETPDKDGKPQRVWRRRPAGGTARLPLVEGTLAAVVPDPEQPRVIIHGRARRAGRQWLVTVFLDNQQREPARNKDAYWLFQVELSVAAPDGAARFEQRRFVRTFEDDAVTPDREAEREIERLDMAYRDTVEFARGHGIGVHADVDPADPRRATRITTAVVPASEVPRTDIPTAEDFPELAGVELDMANLAHLRAPEVGSRLLPLVDAYDAWIGRQAARIGDPAARLSGYEDSASRALAECRRASGRIRAGIELLGDDHEALEAFRFANKAMWHQRVRSRVTEQRRNDQTLDPVTVAQDEDQPRNRSWRPFQLAFVLLNLPSLADPRHPDRADPADAAPSNGGDERRNSAAVDLLAFPTGGGKTEAYLGLTAFTLAIRRLRGHLGGYGGDGQGVAVLMRYTLRLLTLQQFQRAAALLCACERLRQEAAEAEAAGGPVNPWGATPFRIGLWVGRAATPTTTQEAKEWVERQRKATGGRPRGSGSPAQLTSCPWCGTMIDPGADIDIDPERERTLTYCGDLFGQCPFSRARSAGEGLPVVVVDHEIYRLLPALLIGTVDKFAQMPWQGAVQTLFGRVSGHCERHGWCTPDLNHPDSHPRKGSLPGVRTVAARPLRPPDLIIQDELHLIAGPLGSLVGLYETAVDRLSTWELDGRAVRPKVIASTATVRQARKQAHALFLRDLHLFPPPGLDARDSFFALQRPVSEQPGRRYLGICAHGRRLKSTLIRVYVALLAAGQTLHERHGRAAETDPYMTLLGYFNSLRELGGMRRLVDDDVATRLDKIDQRGLTRRRLFPDNVQELTSRLGSVDIPRVLDRLSVRFGPKPAAVAAARSSGGRRGTRRPAGGQTPIDVLLATNMVSVGVDVPRLGLMVVSGQPKATAEYIQATSRVGREHPGLVITVYNWARPRDLSHYESFEQFHATFYRHVEALTVTPFAARALDRGLTALLTGLVRLQDGRYNRNADAGRIDRDDQLVTAVATAISDRASAVTGDPAMAAQAAEMLEARLAGWAREAAVPGRTLSYKKPRRGQGDLFGLLHEPSELDWSVWTCPQSLREVEPGIGLMLREDWPGDRDAPPFEPRPAKDQDDPAGATEDDE